MSTRVEKAALILNGSLSRRLSLSILSMSRVRHSISDANERRRSLAIIDSAIYETRARAGAKISQYYRSRGAAPLASPI